MNNRGPGSHGWKNHGLLLALLLATSMLFYVRRVLIPYQRADALAHDHPRGNLSDLYPRWLSARELLLHGRDPYSPEITREIEIGYYGRAIDPSRPGDPKDQQAFAYPVYSVFLLAPLVYMPFQIIRWPFYGFLTLLIAASVILWLRVLRWSPRRSYVAAIVVLVLGSLPVIQAIELQQLTLVVIGLLTICAVLVVNGRFVPAGIVLAVATIKPQLVLPLILWLTLWTASDWARRRTFLYGFLATMGILIAASEYLLPGWIPEFFRAVVAYRRYTPGESLLVHLSNARWGLLLSAIVVLITARVCWRRRRGSEQSEGFVATLSLVLVSTLMIIPSVSTYNQVLLLPAVLILIRYWNRLWKQNPLARLAWILAAVVILWPWLAAAGLTLAFLVLPATRVQQAWALPFYTSIATPLAVFGLLLQQAYHVSPSDRHSARVGPAL